MSVFCVSSSRHLRLVCGLSLWQFLVILTYGVFLIESTIPLNSVIVEFPDHSQTCFLQPCNYLLSKSIVHENKFGDIDVICHIVTGILILIGSLRCL